MTIEYAEPGRSACPWNDEDDITFVWPRGVVRWSPLEPEPFVTDVPVPTEPTPCWDEPDLWFPSSGGQGVKDMAYAKARCQGCWMLRDCREYALDHDVEGVWGGMSKADRNRIRKPAPTLKVEPVEFASPGPRPRMKLPTRRSA